MTFGILLFIVALLIVIMVHEAGHFVAAKLLGFKATKFFVGFGPTVWSFRKGETEYGIKLIPAGGFVKIVGMNPYEDVAPEDEHRSYPNKPRWQRAIMIAAGPATHWPLAFIILAVGAMTVGLPTDESTNVVSVVESRIDGELTPAADAGFQPGDRIVSVNGTKVDAWEETRSEIRANAGETTTFRFVREGQELEVTAELGTAVFDKEGRVLEYAPPGEGVREPQEGETVVGFLGVQPEARVDRMGPGEAIVTAGRDTIFFTGVLFMQLGEPFETVFNGDLWRTLVGEGERDPEEGPVGIVGAGRIAGETVQRGLWMEFGGLIVMLTLFVGLVNLLPLPPLDGGHLAVIAYESVTRRSVDIRKLIPIAAAVISFFVLLFFAVLYLDLARPLRVPL